MLHAEVILIRRRQGVARHSSINVSWSHNSASVPQPTRRVEGHWRDCIVEYLWCVDERGALKINEDLRVGGSVAVIEDTETAANRRLAVPEHVICETDARADANRR